jgi:excisionase family DNA binding protein
MSEPIEKPLKATEVAERLSCSLQNVYDIINAGLLPAFRVGLDGGGIRVA